jgi:hypothetical protein
VLRDEQQHSGQNGPVESVHTSSVPVGTLPAGFEVVVQAGVQALQPRLDSVRLKVYIEVLCL